MKVKLEKRANQAKTGPKNLQINTTKQNPNCSWKVLAPFELQITHNRNRHNHKHYQQRVCPVPLGKPWTPLFPSQTASLQLVSGAKYFAMEQSWEKKHYQQLPLVTTLSEGAALLEAFSGHFMKRRNDERRSRTQRTLQVRRLLQSHEARRGKASELAALAVLSQLRQAWADEEQPQPQGSIPKGETTNLRSPKGNALQPRDLERRL